MEVLGYMLFTLLTLLTWFTLLAWLTLLTWSKLFGNPAELSGTSIMKSLCRGWMDGTDGSCPFSVKTVTNICSSCSTLWALGANATYNICNAYTALTKKHCLYCLHLHYL